MGPRGEMGPPGSMGPPGPQGPSGISLPGEPVSYTHNADVCSGCPYSVSPHFINSSVT